MNSIRNFFLIAIILGLLAACSPQSQAVPEASEPSPAMPSPQAPTDTPQPSQTPTATLQPASPTPTETQLPSPSATPFPGFSRNFKFYQAWTKDETTWFYFMSAYVDQTVYALADDLEGNQYALTCPQDATYPQDLRCYSDVLFKGKNEYKVTFFSDAGRQYPFHEMSVNSNLHTTYLTYDNCESEYRIYDGRCYAAITCYGENGDVVYTFDNIPYNGNFEGFSVPCP